MLGIALDQLIDLGFAFRGHTEQIIGEAADFRVKIAAFVPERLAHFFDGLFSHVHLEQHLQSQFTGFPARARLAHRLPAGTLAVCAATLSRSEAISTAASPAS
jgi:hypothetical protein